MGYFLRIILAVMSERGDNVLVVRVRRILAVAELLGLLGHQIYNHVPAFYKPLFHVKKLLVDCGRILDVDARENEGYSYVLLYDYLWV